MKKTLVCLAALAALSWADTSSAQRRNSRCNYDDTPKYCATHNWCCETRMTHTCRGYSGDVREYAQYDGKIFCVQPRNDRDRRHLRDNCASFARC